MSTVIMLPTPAARPTGARRAGRQGLVPSQRTAGTGVGAPGATGSPGGALMTVAEVVRHALTTLTAGDGVRAVRVAPTGPQAPSEEDDDGAGLAVVLDLTPLLARRRVALER